MPNLIGQLILERCPHCSIGNPNLPLVHYHSNTNFNGKNTRFWATYQCMTCGGMTLAVSNTKNGTIEKIYPEPEIIADSIPPRAREYLTQAINSINAPAGAIMLAASSVDAMLQAKGYKDKEGKLFARIKKATDDHLITQAMAEWAHEIRLEANDQRHSDESSPLPTEEDAIRVIEFTKELAQFLFVMPSRVQRGLKQAKEEKGTGG